MANKYSFIQDSRGHIRNNPCPKGGKHQYGTDGMHSNEYCKKCFQDAPEGYCNYDEEDL